MPTTPARRSTTFNAAFASLAFAAVLAPVSVRALGSGPTAQAAKPAKPDTVRACFDRKTGDLRLLFDKPGHRKCRAGETKIVWKQGGPGARGPQGP